MDKFLPCAQQYKDVASHGNIGWSWHITWEMF